MPPRRLQSRASVRAAALAAGVIVFVFPAAALGAGPGRAFFGLQSGLANSREVGVMKRGGVGTLRAVFDAGVEASRDPARWEPYDTLMMAAARSRIRVLPVLIGNAVPHPGLNRPRTRTERAAWARFVSDVVGRYGRSGTFWAAHPEVEPLAITAYQVWNEPNLPGYWRPTNDAAGYLRLVRLTRARLLAVDPQAQVVLAGLPDSRHGTRMLDYVRAIYSQPGARTLFDVVALNPYAPDADGVLEKLSQVRAYMDRRGDRATPIWITEIGWATGGPKGPFRTSKRGQAARISRTFQTLIAARVRLRLGRLIVFNLQDRAYGPTERPWWGARTGLFDVAGRPKPAWNTFVGFTGGRPGGRLRSVPSRERVISP